MEFSDLSFGPHLNFPGVQAKASFPNGYGASVIKGVHSYGGDQGLYELAIIYNGNICYDSGLTDDVVGWLSEEDVTEWLKKIEALPARRKSD